jgi:hypothetical protein
MSKWKPLAAAVSKASFDEHIAAFGQYIERARIRRQIELQDDEFARKISPLGLARGADESSKDYYRRVLLRRPATNKPLDEAFRPPGRRPRKPMRGS